MARPASEKSRRLVIRMVTLCLRSERKREGMQHLGEKVCRSLGNEGAFNPKFSVVQKTRSMCFLEHRYAENATFVLGGYLFLYRN